MRTKKKTAPSVPIRLIALDLDGTLLDDNKQISAATRDALHAAAARGVQIVLASGRMSPAITPVADDLAVDGPIISYNGARVIGPAAAGRDVWWNQPLPARYADELIAYHERHGIQMNYYLDDVLYSVDRPEMRPFLELYCRRTGSAPHFMSNLRGFIGREPTKIILLMKPSRRDELFDVFKKKYGGNVWVVKSDPEYLEFLNSAVNKGQAFRILCRRLGIDPAETMACGDGDNDADMLAAAGVGVAMANASEASKAAARYTTRRSNHEGGVAEAVERFVLGD